MEESNTTFSEGNKFYYLMFIFILYYLHCPSEFIKIQYFALKKRKRLEFNSKNKTTKKDPFDVLIC